MALTHRYHGSLTALHLLCRNMNNHQDLPQKIELLLEIGDADELRRLTDEDRKDVWDYAKENNVSIEITDLLTTKFYFWCLNGWFFCTPLFMLQWCIFRCVQDACRKREKRIDYDDKIL